MYPPFLTLYFIFILILTFKMVNSNEKDLPNNQYTKYKKLKKPVYPLPKGIDRYFTAIYFISIRLTFLFLTPSASALSAFFPQIPLSFSEEVADVPEYPYRFRLRSQSRSAGHCGLFPFFRLPDILWNGLQFLLVQRQCGYSSWYFIHDISKIGGTCFFSWACDLGGLEEMGIFHDQVI